MESTLGRSGNCHPQHLVEQRKEEYILPCPTLPQSLFAEQVVRQAQKVVREGALQTGHRQFLVDIQPPLVWVLACPFQLSLTFVVGTQSPSWVSWQLHCVLSKALRELKKCANFFSFLVALPVRTQRYQKSILMAGVTIIMLVCGSIK